MRSFIARAKGACSLAAIALMIGAGSVGAETVTFDLETATIEDINAAPRPARSPRSTSSSSTWRASTPMTAAVSC